MKTRIIAQDHVAGIASAVGLDALMDEMISRLAAATIEFDEERTLVRSRDGFHYTEPDIGLLEWMPVMHTAELTTVKVVGYHPSNPHERNLPTILSTISAYDTASGHLIALADGTFVTALRTGAASAVASRHLADPNSRVLGLVGCGAQSITQMHAILRTFPIETVLIVDIDPTAADSFPERAAAVLPDNVLVKQVPLDVLLARSDIVCTTTSVGIDEGPLFADQETKPWVHINAVGSDFPGKVELPIELLRRSLVCPDHREQAIKEGECQQLEPGEIGPALAELVAATSSGETLYRRPTVFDSTGWALEDRVAMQMLLEHSERLGLGLSLQLEDTGNDPLNPYDIVTEVD
ncbi:MAG: ornithine cyclodeaminase family protein [Acidimicrobiia bacterium]|nr:ornithine cyclodeaminase family protein [Acidimicrobiia bacterium]